MTIIVLKLAFYLMIVSPFVFSNKYCRFSLHKCTVSLKVDPFWQSYFFFFCFFRMLMIPWIFSKIFSWIVWKYFHDPIPDNSKSKRNAWRPLLILFISFSLLIYRMTAVSWCKVERLANISVYHFKIFSENCQNLCFGKVLKHNTS